MTGKYFQYTTLLFALIWLMTACSKDEPYTVPEAKDALQNDCIKRSLGPNLVGRNIEFAYAIALPAARGKIVSAQVEASIAGNAATWLEHRSYYTNGSGQDVGIQVGDPSANQSNVTTVNFTKDTNAVTLRYYYNVPEAARGRSVSFKFSAKSSSGETVNFSMGPYNISRMDMALDLPVKDSASCLISIADMKAYTAAEAAANGAKIDVVYLYRALPDVAFNHSLVSPGTRTAFLPNVVLPPNATNISKISKVWALRDQHLARGQWGVYVDDVDFQKLDIASAPDYAINLKEEAGVWIETADGKYRAYIYVNKADNAGKSAVLSMKRYTMK
jgi:hypothetical protein